MLLLVFNLTHKLNRRNYFALLKNYLVFFFSREDNLFPVLCQLSSCSFFFRSFFFVKKLCFFSAKAVSKLFYHASNGSNSNWWETLDDNLRSWISSTATVCIMMKVFNLNWILMSEKQTNHIFGVPTLNYNEINCI